MNVKIQTVHFDADSKLIEHVNAKIEKLKTFHDKIIGAEVYLKLDNNSHQVRDKVAEIKVHVPKHSYFVKHQSKNFEEFVKEIQEKKMNFEKKKLTIIENNEEIKNIILITKKQ